MEDKIIQGLNMYRQSAFSLSVSETHRTQKVTHGYQSLPFLSFLQLPFFKEILVRGGEGNVNSLTAMIQDMLKKQQQIKDNWRLFPKSSFLENHTYER